jgi:hypothetical protein
MAFTHSKKLCLQLLLLAIICMPNAFCQPQPVPVVPASPVPVPGAQEVAAPATDVPAPLVWQVQQDPQGICKILKGSQFRIRLDQDLNSGTANQGQAVSCSLIDEMRAGNELVATPGQQVLGIISSVAQSRKTIKSYKPGKNFLDAQGRIGFSFSGIVNPQNGSLIKIDAVPSEKTRIDQIKKTKAQLVANKNGEYVVKYAVGKYAALDLAIGTAGLVTGPVGIVTSALVSGAVGSVNKNFAAGRPVEEDENYTKKQGFMMGVGRGLPGGFLIQGVTTSGKELELNQGDILTVSLRQDLEVRPK